MRITRFRIERFKKFTDYSLHLEPGINIIKGSNEAGKSTMLEGLVVVLFFSPNQKLDRYRTWNTDRVSNLELEFNVSGQDFLLRKDFEAGQVCLGYLGGGRETTAVKSLKNILGRFLGLDSSEAFLATACVRQHELDMVSGTNIPFRLEQILLGSSQDTLGIIKRLNQAIGEFDKGVTRPAKDPGILVRLEKQLDLGQQRYQEIQEKLNKKNNYQEQVAKWQRELADYCRQEESKRIILDKVRRRYQLEEEKKDLEKKYESLYQKRQQIEILQKRGETIDREISQHSLVTDPKEIELLLDNIRRLEAVLSAAKGRLLENNLFLLGLVTVTVIVSLAAIFYKFHWLWGTLVTIWFAIGLARYNLWRKRNAVSQELGKILDKTKCDSITRIKELAAQYRQLAKEREAVNNQLQGWLGEKDIAGIMAEESALAQRLAVNKQQLTPELENITVSAEELFQLENDLQSIKNKISGLQNRLTEYRAYLKDISVSDEDLAKAAEEISRGKTDWQRAETKYKALLLVREKIKQARVAVLEESAQEFQTNIADYLSRFTKGRYRQIKTEIGDNGLTFQVYSTEKNEWALPPELSSGTQDQIYLAARLRLLQLVAGDARPPLILDDPFSNFDNARVSEVMKVCREISQEHQVIIFTCSDRYNQYADNIVTLPDNISKEVPDNV